MNGHFFLVVGPDSVNHLSRSPTLVPAESWAHPYFLMRVQVSDSHSHMIQQLHGEGFGQRQGQQRMRDSR